MYTLYLPSLEEKRFVTISNLSLDETLVLCSRFTDDVKNSRKLKEAGDTANVMLVQDVLPDTFDCDPDDFFEVLSISNARGIRGARPVFIDVDNNSFGVGTTVVYNQNWATVGFEDTTIISKISNYFGLGLVKTNNDGVGTSWFD